MSNRKQAMRWIKNSVIKNTLGSYIRSGRKRLRERQWIEESGLFDADWYLYNNEDILSLELDPLDHYILYGAAEGRAAGPNFNTQAYLNANRDVALSPINPLVHYLRHGAKEGRGFAEVQVGADSLRCRTPSGDRKVSFTLILHSGQKSALSKTLRTIKAQKAINFELIISNLNSSFPLDAGQYPEQTRFVSANTPALFIREAIKLANHDYIIIIDAGDILEPGSLHLLARNLAKTDNDILYSDEASIETGHDPFLSLKPAWSPELLTAYNYFGRLTAIRRVVALEALPDPLDGQAAEWSLNLRVAERTRRIGRLTKVLCLRAVANTDRAKAGFHRDDYEGVLTAYWRRQQHDALVDLRKDNTFHSTWPLPRRPLISVIIPNKDQAHLLKICINGLLHNTEYDNIEIIIVDNRSTQVEVLDFYKEIEVDGAQVIYFDEIFNYSRACNLGASAARGELLLFLNNDIEMQDRMWLDELVRQALEPGVGIVGAKLLYPDGEIQHAGVALGLFTLAAHVFHRAPSHTWGVFGSPDVQRNWTAVTGACQLVHRSVFDLIGGYDEEFLISYSDIVICMSAVRAGFRIVYAPAAILVHHEGASRGQANPGSDQVLFAKRLKALAIDSDPYFHPALDTESFVPRLRPSNISKLAGQMREDIERLSATPNRNQPLDLFSDGTIASALGMSWSDISWKFDLTDLNPGPVAGARILIELLRRRPDLRNRFPYALTDGRKGNFVTWVCAEGLALLGLPATFAASVEAAFAADMGASARKCLIDDVELRRVEPLLFLPDGRQSACRRLFQAVEDEALTLEESWWFLLTCAEQPLNELCWTWTLTIAWQEAVPDGCTSFGLVSLRHWISETYDVKADWLFAPYQPGNLRDADQVRIGYAAHKMWREQFPNALTDPVEAKALLEYLSTRASQLPFPARAWSGSRDIHTVSTDLQRIGVNILGHFAYPSGLRISTESVVASLSTADVAMSLRNVPVSPLTDDAVAHQFVGLEVFDTTIIHVQPQPFFSDVYQRSNLRARSDRTYRIGYWYWEFDDVPSDWDRAALDCDEIWTATEFVAEGLRRRYSQPVNVLPPGIEIEEFERLPRSHFGLSDSQFLFLFVFHMTSVMDRKNPIGLIKAFLEAFQVEDSATLVIKTSFGSEQPEQFSQLCDAARHLNVILIDEIYSRHETLSLIAACDAYVSLHRSEGLGLTMAEAMLLERPVIATRYSGNLDFMNDHNSLLVDFKPVTLYRDTPPYLRGQRWAEPSLKQAASHMRRLYDDRCFSRDLGIRARDHLVKNFSYSESGRLMMERIIEINKLR